MRPPLDPKSPTVRVLLNLPATLLAAIDREAKRRGIGRSATVRALLAEALRVAGRKSR